MLSAAVISADTVPPLVVAVPKMVADEDEFSLPTLVPLIYSVTWFETPVLELLFRDPDAIRRPGPGAEKLAVALTVLSLPDAKAVALMGSAN